MRKRTWLSAVFSVLVLYGGVTSTAGAATPKTGTPLFGECPAVGADAGCQYLISVTDLTTSMASDPSQPSYAANLAATHESGTPTDVLIGVRNESSQPVTHLDISGPITFEFDGDGVCNNASGPVPIGCQSPGGSTACGADKGSCSYTPPPGEPAGYTEERALAGTPAFPNGDVQNGYEGPTTWFSNVAPSPSSSGTVNFSPALAPGASTFFALEAPPKNYLVTTAVNATQSAAGMSGATLYLPSGFGVQGQGVLTGGVGQPKGQMTFQTFGNNACTGAAATSSTVPLGAGGVGAASMLTGRSGTYYWRVGYSGDGQNAAAQTTCGNAVVVVPPGGRAGLPASRRCVSTVTAALRVGRTRARSSLVFAGTRLLGRFGGRIRVRVRKRTRISVIAAVQPRAFGGPATTTAGLVQQSRTYRACARPRGHHGNHGKPTKRHGKHS